MMKIFLFTNAVLPNFSRSSATDHLFWTNSFHFIKYISRLQQFLIFRRCENCLYSCLMHKHKEEIHS